MSKKTGRHSPEFESLFDSYDFPHLRDGAKWNSEATKKRAIAYGILLVEKGLSEIDTVSLIADLYWDCFTELKLAAAKKSQ